MEVIGTCGQEYIVKISHSEIEKVLGKSHSCLPSRLNVGNTVNLGAGYDFTAKISEICNSMVNTMQSFDQSKKILTDFCLMVSKIEKQEK